MSILQEWKKEAEHSISMILRVPLSEIPLLTVKQQKRIVALIELIEQLNPPQSTIEIWGAKHEVHPLPDPKV